MTVDPADLTLEQKTSLLSGRDLWSTKPVAAAGIPAVMLTDGPHGIRMQEEGGDHLAISESALASCFPAAVAVGSSWDPAVAERAGAAVGREARAFGGSVVLGPGVNIKRSPLCGRNFEYYSEDPLVAGRLGAAHVAGMQAQGPGASVKHFAANNQETERMRISADVDERTLREIYLPAFERVVTEAQPAMVMCSYNKINGVRASHHPWLLTQVLRNEWDFDGAVVSDWGAVSDRVAGVAAGMDLEMPGSGGGTDAEIVAAVRAGGLDEETVDVAVRRVLTITQLPREATNDLDIDRHHALAREIAGESIILLKNDDETLPLARRARVAVVGPFAKQPRFQGGGSSRINPTRVDAALDEMRAIAEQHAATVTHAPGLSVDSGHSEEALSEAASAASASDVAVVFAGLADRDESEGFDRETLALPDEQVELIKRVAAVAPKTVVVLSHGGVVTLEDWHDDVDAIVEGFLLGQAGGGALADVLFGVINPSGRLAETIPLRLQDNPSWLNFPGEQGHVRYGEGVLVGYRYYVTAGVPVRYPFGHGLSYTSFTTTDLHVETTGPDTAVVRVTTTNIGERTGKHVVQLYVSTETGPVRRPLRELRAFEKIALEPGESRTVEVFLDRRAFAYWDIELDRWVVPEGHYTIQVGQSAQDIVAEAPLWLSGDPLAQRLSMDSSIGEWLAHPVVGPALRDTFSALLDSEQTRSLLGDSDIMRMIDSMPMRQVLAFTGDAVSQDALDELIDLSRRPVEGR